MSGTMEDASSLEEGEKKEDVLKVSEKTTKASLDAAVEEEPSNVIIPQMNVYVLDDTPSVVSSSQQPPPLVVMKESASGGGGVDFARLSPYKEADTTLSLDKEEPVSDLDKSPPSDPEHRSPLYNSVAHRNENEMLRSARADPDEDASSSSNDDSSYFASHLPEPNSGRRRYSWASNASQNSRKPMDRESDASLSLSDDSDDANPPPTAFYPESSNNNSNNPPPSYFQPQFLMPRGPVPPELYPQQQIMPRMHSIHSLASTSSQSDTSLPDLAPRTTPVVVPSGRRSPPLPAAWEQPSPPNIILHSFSNDTASAGLPHPQPQAPARRRHEPPDQFVYQSGGDSDPAMVWYGGDRRLPHAFGEPRVQRRREEPDAPLEDSDRGFQLYWQRWLMLMYMSVLNLLSDWTCYSVAPIALLTEEAFGEINAEQLVVVFLIANGIATACEPILLSRLGLRRTVLFGALLLMIGSIVKSGGMPPIIQADLKKGQGEWRVYLGFFLVGLSQPLYQCTPALLSASWFPEAERTLATGVALNANQLGIGFAFIFGTMLVETSDDIPKYFSLLSILSTLTFLGTLIQFDDAPPTPPSDTAKVMRGTLEAKLPSVQSLFDTVRNIGASNNRPVPPASVERRSSAHKEKRSSHPTDMTTPDGARSSAEAHRRSSRRGSAPERRPSRRHTARRRTVKKSNLEAHGPSPARWGPVRQPPYERTNAGGMDDEEEDARIPLTTEDAFLNPDLEDHNPSHSGEDYRDYSLPSYMYPPEYPMTPDDMYGQYPSAYPQQYPFPYWDPNYMAQLAYFQQHSAQMAYPPMYPIPPMDAYGSYQHSSPYPPYPFSTYEPMEHLLPAAEAIDEGAEPVITILPHHLDIHIRDDQIWLSTRACLARPGFVHSLVSFTVSGVVINTLSTFMDYLVRLNGAGREYTGIVGGTFQFVIMISSLIIGKVCDKTRAYYSITIGMLVLGAFGLAECGVSLDSNSGVSLRWSLIIVALLVGPLQPVSTELGVDVVYPLSENTVLVIQQLFSNLLSAAFIPCFKAMKDVGAVSLSDGVTERPAYTFSFYLLIVVHACATVFFATFNGRYLRYEHELEKQSQEARRRAFKSVMAYNRNDRDTPPDV